MAKKIKKVDTPIDQRETFVSIQKNFADSELSVEEKLRTLYDLQQADSEIDKILQLRGELPSEVAALEEEISVLKGKAAAISAEIEGFNESVAQNKENIIECDTQIAKYNEQLNNISNSREYDSINKEIENQELLRKIAEKHIGEIKSEILARKADLEDMKDLIDVRNEDLKVKKEELDNIVESTAKEENALRAKRSKCASIIDPRTMSAYERIRESVHNHLAVVTVYNGNACGGCFNMIIPQRLIELSSNKKLIICEHCGRIIVNPDFSNKE
jgi:predicted  nucleic acid-binding Zn-ribbon protein